MSRRTLNLYFLRRFLVSFGSTLVAVFALTYLIDMIEVSRRGSGSDVSFATIATISALRVPAFIEQAFPFIILFSSIFTLVSLNRKMELVVARASGVSVWQMLAPFIVGSLLLGVGSVALYNPLAAYAQGQSARLETMTGGVTSSGNGDRAPWLRQNGDGTESIIGAKAVSAGGAELGGVTAFILSGEGIVEERIDAARARLGDGAWIIEDPTVTRIGFPPVKETQIRLPTTLLPEYVEQRLADPEAISIWELGGKIEIARSLGYNAEAFAMRFHALLARPALFVAMSLVAATVAVRYTRIGQSGRMIVGGVAAGFVLYVITFLAQALGSNSVIPPIVAAWFPVVAAGLFGVTILLHQEDG
ncbi:LPS export ABC transporter permease LptG [Aureimonas sp. AU12]|uniref:LPS export ABC transporter permease LptG n=1 Tax=Aureimonas sp. AU12 TaxID=1638161 RepID=UPI0007835E6A|nr:LPS export ABC transporter permease LptG [Aureimonas sp. AU12]